MAGTSDSSTAPRPRSAGRRRTGGRARGRGGGGRRSAPARRRARAAPGRRERAIGPGSPCLGPDRRRRMDERDRRRAVRRPGRPPGPPGRRAGWSDRRVRDRAAPASGRGRAGRRSGRFAVGIAAQSVTVSQGPGPPVPTVRRSGDPMLRSSRRATPQGRRERGAHRPACHGRRPRSGRFDGPQPIRPAGRRISSSDVEIAAAVRGTAMTTEPLDPGARSAGNLDPGSTLFEPAQRTEPPQARLECRPAQAEAPESVSRNPWRLRRQRLLVRARPLRQRHRVRPEADERAGRCRPPDAAVRDARRRSGTRERADR